MGWRTKADRWLAFEELEDTLKEQLRTIEKDEQLLEDHFYKDLQFGTGGMRGEMGPGTNRINIYTVRRAAQGLAQYMEDQGREAMKRGVVIAFDSRHLSSQFALEAAKTLGKRGIQVYLFDELCPTPVLSFAVRHLHAYAGVMITASHNPPEYNGLKLYGEDGGQLPPLTAGILTEYIQRSGNELLIETEEAQQLLKQGRFIYIGEEINQAYIHVLKTIQLQQQNNKDLAIVFTPLHGTGNKLIQRGLTAFGFEKVTVVKEQETADPDFSTVQSPNPEEHEAFKLAIRYGEKAGADLLIATDPDADRLGLAVRNHQNEYVVLTGNQTGALMLHYLLEKKKQQGTLSSNGVLIKTIVTSELGRAIADHYGVTTIDTLTGFKFIGERIKQLEQAGKQTFLFGYEESYGYLADAFVRDKDAIQSAVLAAEMAAYYKKQGQSLYDQLLVLFETYGFYQESTYSLSIKGRDGEESMLALFNTLRSAPPKWLNEVQVTEMEDYASGQRLHLSTGDRTPIHLPKANVLKFKLADGSWVCIRPSGTEPKVKFYFAVKEATWSTSQKKLAHLEKKVLEMVSERKTLSALKPIEHA